MTLEKLLQDVHRAAEEKARIDTCVELYLEGNLPHHRSIQVPSQYGRFPGHGGYI